MKPVRKISQSNSQKDISNRVNVAILASGNGTNFEALVKAVRRKKIKANIKLLITDKQNAFVRKRARRLGVEDIFINPKNFKSRLLFDKEIIAILQKEKISLIALAGYMRVLSPHFVKSFQNKILNIHPALLPSFKGGTAIEDAYNYGCKITGVTVHFVDEKVDHGPIILQESLKISDKITPEALEKKIHKIEHKLYPLALKLCVEKKLKIRGRHVKII